MPNATTSDAPAHAVADGLVPAPEHARSVHPRPGRAPRPGETAAFEPPASLWRLGGPVALLLGALSALLAFTGSWIPSLWGDEAASSLSAQRPLPSLFMMLGHVDAVHGTYYLGLHAWVAVFGASPVSLRAPSALAVGVATAVVVLLCARLGGRRLAVVAGVISAVLPRLTYAGEEARSFAFDAAIAAVLTLLLVELLVRRGRPFWLWAVYAGTLCLGGYLFLYLALIAAAHAVVLILSRPGRRFVVTWAVATAAALLGMAPMVAWGFAERRQIAYLANQPEVTANSIVAGLWFDTVWFAVVAWALIAFGLAAASVTWWRGRRTPSLGSARSFRLPSAESAGAAWLVIPSVLLIGSNAIEHDFTARYLTFCAPAAAILIACGIVRLASLLASVARVPRVRPAVATAVIAAAVVAAVAPVYLAQRTPFAKNESDWAQLAAVVHANAQPGDAIAFDDSTRPSQRPRLAMNTYPAAFAGLRDVMLQTPYPRNTTWHDAALTVPQAIAAGRLHDVHRLWLVEYSTPGHVDTWGITDLRAEGFHEVRRFVDHRSDVIELVRGDATTHSQTNEADG